VSNEKGERFEGSYVADQFVQHFKNFLGNKVAVQSMDLESLNCNIVGDDDAANMIKAMSDTEIRRPFLTSVTTRHQDQMATQPNFIKVCGNHRGGRG
ncbi:hypothetical protein Tco_0714513, partial [Tanacetum coccineum]